MVQAASHSGILSAFEGDLDPDSAVHGKIVAVVASRHDCQVSWTPDNPAESIAYSIGTDCEAWAYSEFNSETQQCTGILYFYSGGMAQSGDGERRINPSRCFVICCDNVDRGVTEGNKVRPTKVTSAGACHIFCQALVAMQSLTHPFACCNLPGREFTMLCWRDCVRT